MKIVSWNVAGFRACLRKGFRTFFEQTDADIVCLQEVKATKEQYDFHPQNYYEYLNAAERKGYSGVLIYTKQEPLTVTYGIGKKAFDCEGRLLTLEYKEFYLVNVYVPNVQRTLARMEFRIEWEKEFRRYIRKLDKEKPVIICGDFNVAHTEMDIKNAKQNRGNAGFTDEERLAFTNLLNLGLVDIYRNFYPDKLEAYTWWSYMKGVRERNIGWRIDYFLISKRWIKKVEDVHIYSSVYGSDHCPVGIQMKENIVQ